MCESFMLSLCFLFEYMYFLFFFNKGSSLGLVSFKMISKEIFFVCLFLSSKYLYEVYISSFSVFFVSLGVIPLFLFNNPRYFLFIHLFLLFHLNSMFYRLPICFAQSHRAYLIGIK